jgi:hypothetical protein
MDSGKPAVMWLQKATIIIIFILLFVVYAFQIYQLFDVKLVRERLNERELIMGVIGKKSDSLKQIIIRNQVFILHNQDSILILLKNKK